MNHDQEHQIAERLTFIDEEWQGEPLTDEDVEILSGAIPALAEGFGELAPVHFPDGSSTGAQAILQALGAAVMRTAAAARSSGDFETPWRLFVLMRYVRQPHAVPLSAAWVSLVAESRAALEEMGDSDALAAVEAGAKVNQTWWEQNGQWATFTTRLVDASTPDAVSEVVVMPPEPGAAASPSPSSPSSSIDSGAFTEPRIPDAAQRAMRTARAALAVAIAALLIGPLIGFLTARALEVPGPRGPQGPQGQQGPMGPQGDPGEGADEAINRIDELTSCVNDYMDTVGRAGGGAYRYYYHYC